jgi:capsular polysaccharide biosynthesis protein
MQVKANGVELRDWTRVMGRRLTLLAVIPLAAMLIAGVLAVLEPQTYRATATVIMPGQTTSGPVSSAVSQFVADFEGAITSDGVAQATSVATGEPKSSISNGIGTKREGTSAVVEVTYTSSSADRAGPVAETAARVALGQIAQIQLDVDQAQLDAADDAYTQAQADLQAVGEETGIVDFSYFQVVGQKRLIQLRDELQAAQESGDGVAQATTRFNEASTSFTERQQKYQAALDRLTDVQDARTFFAGEVLDSQGVLVQAQANSRVQASPARATNRLTFVFRRAVFAAAFGLLLAIALIVLMEFLRPSPLNRIRREAGLPAEPGSRRAPGQYVG